MSFMAVVHGCCMCFYFFLMSFMTVAGVSSSTCASWLLHVFLLLLDVVHDCGLWLLHVFLLLLDVVHDCCWCFFFYMCFMAVACVSTSS